MAFFLILSALLANSRLRLAGKVAVYSGFEMIMLPLVKK